MKQFISIVRKEFLHIFRDRRTMLILLAMPLIQMLLFGFAITTEVKDVSVAVFDPSKDQSTTRIINEINASDYFTVDRELTEADDINDIFKYGKVGLVMVFEDNFADNMLRRGGASVQLITDGTEPNQATMISSYASGIINTYQHELCALYNVPMQVTPVLRLLYNPQSESSYNFVPGVMGLILILICAMMTSIAIVREKENGTMEVLLASPMKPIYIILAKAIPYFFLSVFDLTMILLLSVFVLHVPVVGNLFWLMLISLVFILLALSLGLLISTLVDTQMAAMLASGMGLMMPIMILSGLMFPIESMPEPLQWLSTLVPARWYIQAVRKIMIQGVGIEYALKELIILLIMTSTLLVLSLRKFKTRLN